MWLISDLYNAHSVSPYQKKPVFHGTTLFGVKSLLLSSFWSRSVLGRRGLHVTDYTHMLHPTFYREPPKVRDKTML